VFGRQMVIKQAVPVCATFLPPFSFDHKLSDPESQGFFIDLFWRGLYLLGMKVYYRIIHSRPSDYVVRFWTKDDGSNAITEHFVTLDETKLKTRIESVLGHKNLTLIKVK
jgi:hypothetical protein